MGNSTSSVFDSGDGTPVSLAPHNAAFHSLDHRFGSDVWSRASPSQTGISHLPSLPSTSRHYSRHNPAAASTYTKRKVSSLPHLPSIAISLWSSMAESKLKWWTSDLALHSLLDPPNPLRNLPPLLPPRRPHNPPLPHHPSIPHALPPIYHITHAVPHSTTLTESRDEEKG